MRIKLERAISPEYMEETECGLCSVAFRPESVIAWDEGHAEVVCPECLAYLGERNPARFPSVEEYRAAIERYPEPMYPSVEAILQLEEENPDVAGRVLTDSAVS